MKESIMVLCAHNDDQIIGAGGTLAKYIQEGKKVFVVIFAYGEKSHVWLKKRETIKMRVKESKKSDKILGIKNSIYLGLQEGNLSEDIKQKKLDKKIQDLILKHKPNKIFTHSIDDPHPDHRAVYNTVYEILDNIDYKGELYCFDIWNPINIKKRDKPKLVVDITKTFNKKIKAIRSHKSQIVTLISLLWNIYRKDLMNGLSNKCRYAEVFYKEK